MRKVIEVREIAKQYRLGKVGSGTFSEDIQRGIARMLGRDDPFAELGEVNERDRAGSSPFVWALKDINFDVFQGEVLGIVGKNGAGKSTLLKILSRVAEPTKGSFRIRGRVASLLEVGTGFHPDLSGRENIFLNGSILGMTRQEIRSRFDEIVSFSGIERYIDTPIKRYSSGMKVRLGFAVAAHLEPEILIVDEVLAVGDFEFQRKCMGKMKDVAGHGRTILFVSHNMTAVKNLCTRCIMLAEGKVCLEGSPDLIVNEYLRSTTTSILHISPEQPLKLSDKINLIQTSVNYRGDLLTMANDFEISFTVDMEVPDFEVDFTIHLLTEDETIVFTSGTSEAVGSLRTQLKRGINEIKCMIPAHLLNAASYYVKLLLIKNKAAPLVKTSVLHEIVVHDVQQENRAHFGPRRGVVHPRLHWEVNPTGKITPQV